MKIYSICAFEGFGTLTLQGNGTKMDISLTETDAARFMQLAREVFLEKQKAIAVDVETIPPGFQLEAPKSEPEYTDFIPVDDLPF